MVETGPIPLFPFAVCYENGRSEQLECTPEQSDVGRKMWQRAQLITVAFSGQKACCSLYSVGAAWLFLVRLR